MSVPEISVQIKNLPGQIVQITAVLAEAGIKIWAITASSSGKAGWVRIVVDNCKLAEEALEECGFHVTIGEALAVEMLEDTDGLDRALRILADEKINIDYIYTCARAGEHHHLTIIGVQSPSRAEKLLKSQGLKPALLTC